VIQISVDDKNVFATHPDNCMRKTKSICGASIVTEVHCEAVGWYVADGFRIWIVAGSQRSCCECVRAFTPRWQQNIQQAFSKRLQAATYFVRLIRRDLAHRIVQAVNEALGIRSGE